MPFSSRSANSLAWAGPQPQGVAERACEVAHLADVDGNVGVEGAGGDGEGMPLLGADGGALQEEPLAGFVLHGGLGELDLHGVVGVADNFGDLGGAAGPDFAVDALDEVYTAADELPAPAFVANAVIPEACAGERRVSVDGVADEAACGVGVHAEEERDEEMMGVPEGFEGLLPDLVVCRGVHEEHAEEHDVTCDATGLGVVDLYGSFRADLGAFNVEEVDVVRKYVDTGKGEEGVGTLSVEPLGLVQGEEAELWADEAHEVAAHGQENH